LKRRLANLVLSFVGPITLIVILSMPLGPLTGGLGIIQPIGGIFDNGTPDPGDQTISLPGLGANVEVIIDHLGIPHIYAATAKDAFMALGYMHAKDRLFQITMQTFVAAGRISEIVGAYAASSDRFYRTIGLARSAQETLDWLIANADSNPDVAASLEALDAEVDGINAFIHSLTSATLPIEFKILKYTPQEWSAVDLLTGAKMLGWGLSGGVYDFQRQWIRATVDNDTMYNDLFPDLMPYTVPIVQDQVNLSIAEYPLAPGGFPATENPGELMRPTIADEVVIAQDKLELLISTIDNVIKPLGDEMHIGSNNWAVNGSRSSTGMPILAGDPHLTLQAPSVWYEAHIVVPGVDGLDVTGTTFPGLPAVLIGHNDHLAYSFTNVGADVLDIFVEQLNPSNSSEYMYNGTYHAFVVHDESIYTREGNIIPFFVKESVHGPLIDSAEESYDSDEESEANLAMTWTGSGVTHELIAAGKFMKADNLTQFIDGMYWWDSPPQNCVYGDDSGNIAMLVVGRFPVRSGYTGEYPVTSLNDSVGMVSNIPYAYNPREINPARGFVQSANQRTIAPSQYGYTILGPQDNGYRGRRIFYLLQNDSSVTVADMKRFQADVVEVRAEVILPYLISAWDDAGNSNTTIADAVDLLRSWEYDMEPELEAPTIWLYLLDAIHYETFDELRTLDPLLPLSRTPILEKLITENNSYYFDDHTTTGTTETRDDVLVRSLFTALDKLAREWADEPDYKYGNRHIVYIEHLAGLTYIGGGPHRGGNTLNVAPGWTVTHGPSTRLVADLSNIGMSYMAYPGGQSGNMFSPHWDDNFNLWYAFDPVTKYYGYHILYFYATAAAFRTADTDDTLIERTIIFAP